MVHLLWHRRIGIMEGYQDLVYSCKSTSVDEQSVGIVDGKKMLDLEYTEDSNADVDLNVVKTGSGGYVEIQGTAEQEPFDDKQMDAMLKLADKGIKELIALQKKIVGI